MNNIQDQWQRYYQALPRQLIAFSRYLQGESMRLLKDKFGHNELRLHFEPYIYMLGVEGRRLTELSELISLSKQACNQTVDKLEQLGYVERKPDLHDGRAKRVMLTGQGKQLVRDGIQAAIELDNAAIAHLDKQSVQLIQALLKQLSNAVKIPNYKIAVDKKDLQTTSALLMLLPRLEQYTTDYLKRSLDDKKYENLKPSHLELFNLLGSCDGYIKQMAAVQGVSVQAVSAVARELEYQGYISIQTEVLGERQPRLCLTESGERLLQGMNEVTDELQRQWQNYLGDEAYEHFRDLFARLCEAFALSKYQGQHRSRLEILAQQLKEQLTDKELQELSALLCSSPEALVS